MPDLDLPRGPLTAHLQAAHHIAATLAEGLARLGANVDEIPRAHAQHMLAVARYTAVNADSPAAHPPRYELADFHPETGHLHACTANVHPGTCTRECAAHLYCVAQDAEQEAARHG